MIMTKAATASQAYLLYAALFVLSCYTSTVIAAGSNINIVNKCAFSVTAYSLQSGPTPVDALSFPLAPGQNVIVDVGPTGSNNIWASSSNNANQSQATVLGITRGRGSDYYSISNANAYNLPTQIQPLSQPECKAPSCKIENPAGFCQAPNIYGSAGGNYGEYCINTGGPGNVSTAGTQVFKDRCPDAFSYRSDSAKTCVCGIGGNYNFIFCP